MFQDCQQSCMESGRRIPGASVNRFESSNFFLSEITSYASILTITAFTIERYVAICHPIKTQTLSNLSRAMKTVLTFWILACTFALPYPIHTRVFPYVVVNGTELRDSLQCNIPFKWQRGMTYVFQISTFLFFVFPMLVITVMYALIGLKLRQTELDSKHKSKIRARRAVVRMLSMYTNLFCHENKTNFCIALVKTNLLNETDNCIYIDTMVCTFHWIKPKA